MTTASATYTGGCHCEAVQFEITAAAVLEVDECNCSMCSKTSYLHLIVNKENFKLLRGATDLQHYQFNTRTAQHLFCKYCGVKSFYVPRSHPNGYSVNARCLNDAPLGDMKINQFDGQNWETSVSDYRRKTA